MAGVQPPAGAASVQTLGQMGSTFPVPLPTSTAFVPTLGQRTPGAVETPAAISQGVASNTPPSVAVAGGLGGDDAKSDASGVALPLLAAATVAAPSSEAHRGIVSPAPPSAQMPGGPETEKSTVSSDSKDFLQVGGTAASSVAAAVEEEGGGAEDMEVCPISPNPISEDSKMSEKAAAESDHGAAGGGVAGKDDTVAHGDGGVAHSIGGVTSEKPVIAQVDPREQLIKLSEITRVHVYVAPVTTSELEMPLTSTAPPPSQKATPTPQVPLTTPPTVVVTTPPQEPTTLDDELLKDFAKTTTTTTAEGETTPQGEEFATYSLRSKAAKESKSKPALSAKKTRGGVRPKLLSDSDSDVNYDDYLDQLVEEEEEEPGVGGADGEAGGGVAAALSLTSALSGDFPLLGGASSSSAGVQEEEDVPSLDEQLRGDFQLINGSTGGQQEMATSLQALVGIKPGKSVP